MSEYSPAAQSPSIDATNGDHPPAGQPGDLERRHFQLTHQLFELRTLLKSREGLPTNRVGHVRNRARELERKIELIELAFGAASGETMAALRAEPPRSRAFLQSFYHAAKRQLPPELVARLERAAATTKKF